MKLFGNKYENNELCESILHIGNGYIGVRANAEFLQYGNNHDYQRGTYINGLHDRENINYGEKLYGYADTKESMCNICDTQAFLIYIDNNLLSMDMLEEYSYNFDMTNGVLERNYTFAIHGKKIYINTKRLASFKYRDTIAYKIIIKTSEDADIRIDTGIYTDVANFVSKNDPRLSNEAKKPLSLVSYKNDTNIMNANLIVKSSGIKLNIASKCKTNRDCDIELSDDSVFISKSYITKLKANDVFDIEKIVCMRDSYNYEDISLKNVDHNFGNLRIYQKEFLKSFFNNSRINISSVENLQDYMDYNIFCLLQGTATKDTFSIAAKGLSGEGYEGHVFWDSEMYVAPFMNATNLELAKNIVNYRIRQLPYAIKHARLMGHEDGALYPWRSIEGSECSAYYPAGSAQYHINNDIAYNIMQYYLHSGDIDTLSRSIYVLYEIVKLWIDMGHYTDRGFCVDGVTGPDEYTCIVDNNFYTNVGVKYTMKYFLYAYIELENESKLPSDIEKEVFEKAYDIMQLMYIPYDPNLDINPQDDSFLKKKVLDIDKIPKENFPLLLHYHPLFLYRHQVCKQADVVLAHAIYKDCAKISTKKNSLVYYEKICTHDSSLSLCAYAIMAARLNDVAKAEEQIVSTLRLDIDNLHGNTKDGVHTANMGANFLIMSKGFAGLYLDVDGVSLDPVRTINISDYSFNFYYRGSLISYSADRDKIKLKLLSGKDCRIKIYGEECVVSKKEIIKDIKICNK